MRAHAVCSWWHRCLQRGWLTSGNLLAQHACDILNQNQGCLGQIRCGATGSTAHQRSVCDRGPGALSDAFGLLIRRADEGHRVTAATVRLQRLRHRRVASTTCNPLGAARTAETCAENTLPPAAADLVESSTTAVPAATAVLCAISLAHGPSAVEALARPSRTYTGAKRRGANWHRDFTRRIPATGPGPSPSAPGDISATTRKMDRAPHRAVRNSSLDADSASALALLMTTF